MDRGAFASPKTGIKWRYWIEDAAVELDTLRFDISEMARVGSAGFELLNYQSYSSVQIATGLIPPVILYSNTTSVNTSIPAVSLEPSQTTLFAITSATSLEGVPVPSARIVSADPGVIAVATNTSTSSSSVPVTFLEFRTKAFRHGNW
ncbi:hypothetical protein C8R42DRAFT_725286 [Lentinula raphanica]|nr:hypothetical protein C8R42DRAFT_725286 [Lentinula raphanica]